MTILSTPAVACGAFCVWLGVRIINRRERWAKWSLVGMSAIPALYVLSYAPAVFVVTIIGQPDWATEQFYGFYSPIIAVIKGHYEPFSTILSYYGVEAERFAGHFMAPRS